MSDKDLISTSALTPAHVADLRAIKQKLLELTERAERIIQGSDEVFPAARAGWLRWIKGALGELHAHQGHTLEDTISYCERLVTKRFGHSMSAMQADYVVPDLAAWVFDRKLILRRGTTRIDPKAIPKDCLALTVYRMGTSHPMGTVNLHEGKWIFISIPEVLPEKDEFNDSKIQL